MKKIIFIILIIVSTSAVAQDSVASSHPFSFSGYVEAYYGYDFNRPRNNIRPNFFYSHNRTNEFNINLAYLRGSYTTEHTRATLALATGTYMNANYAAEPGILQNIYEANAGLKLSKAKTLWLDIGVLPSHIGFESARSTDCWTLTRSIIADNSPYFEGGARLSYTSDNQKWLLNALLLNGWQRIQRVSGNSLLSYGTQIQYKPSSRLLLNYSTFFGTDKPDIARLWRYFHDLYAVVQFSDKFGLTAGVDIGREQKAVNDHHLNTWFGTSLILRYQPSDEWAIALRGENYHDKNGVIIPTQFPGGLKTFGGSLNVDKIINKNFYWRNEFRWLRGRDEYFTTKNGFDNNNSVITTSFALNF